MDTKKKIIFFIIIMLIIFFTVLFMNKNLSQNIRNLIYNSIIYDSYIKYFFNTEIKKSFENKVFKKCFFKKIDFINNQPIFLWNNIYLININKKILNLSKKKIYKHLPMLFGPKEKLTKILKKYLIFSKELNKIKLKINIMLITKNSSCNLFTDNNIKIKIGKINNIKRLNNFIEIYPFLKKQIKKNKKIKYVDLRYNYGIAVHWK